MKIGNEMGKPFDIDRAGSWEISEKQLHHRRKTAEIGGPAQTRQVQRNGRPL
ncbi:MAG: hypothetical protein JWP38_2695 [Herbaspirillum sp.]|jgi:hypothetical protein|nr:hypothetical protein [Herbaspirillum sp.]